MRCEAETGDNRRRCGGGGRRLIELLPHTPLLSLSLSCCSSAARLFSSARLSTQIPAVLLYPLRAACVSRIKHCLARASRLSKKSLIRKTQKREERDALRLPDYKTLTLAPVRAANEKKILGMGESKRTQREWVSGFATFVKHHKAAFDVISFCCRWWSKKRKLRSHLGRRTKWATLRGGSYSKCKRPFAASLAANSADELWSSHQFCGFAVKTNKRRVGR